MLARLTIKRRFFVTITAVLVGTSLVVGIISFFTGRSQLHKGYASLANTQYGLFTSIIENDAKGLSRAQVGLTRIESLQRLFVERKWDALLAAASPIFDELRKNENVTHMYFIDMGGRVFLRVHRPEISGDKLTRVTYLKSASTNKSVWGIEMGQNTFSLRCVHPYYYHGKQIGFFEVAEEVDHVISQMKRINGDEVGIFLSNEFMSTKPTQVHNETIGNFTILDSTDKETTLALATALGDDLNRGLKERQVQFISHKGRSYVIALTPFTDANEEVAGVIISHLDITSQIRNMWLGIFFNILTFVLIIAGGALLLIFSLRKSLNLFQSVKEHILAVTTDWDLHRRLKVETTDEVGELGADFNRLTEKLSEIVRKVNDASGEISSISHDIFQASKKVVRGAELQAHGVEVTSSAVMQINASVNGVAQGVDSLSLSASESSSSILEMAASIEEVALNVETLSQSVEEVSSSIIEMASSIKEISRGVQTLMEGASMTASSVAEMDSSIRQVEKNATDTALISETVVRDAELGKSAVEATIAGIREIRRSSSITFEVVENLSKRADDIGTILSVIDEVAEQTNLLALNAAIIAAQAGEHGKGFAVVADEIKELAERTSSSTREIATLIRGVQDETQRAVEAINQAERRIADGEVLSQKSGEVLAKIVTGVQQATDQVTEIARATVEQSRGSHVIREAMERVSEMVGQIANATREQTSGSELIMSAVERMKSLTAQVRNSAREQSKVGGLIARSTENITGMIDQIKHACDEQTRGSEQIVHAVEDIQGSTSDNLEAALVLDNVVNRLTKQIDNLQKEMGEFKV